MIGIENVNEFYTHHYLAAILGGDIRPHLERWRREAKESEGGGGTPWRRLAQLQRDFFRHKERRSYSSWMSSTSRQKWVRP